MARNLLSLASMVGLVTCCRWQDVVASAGVRQERQCLRRNARPPTCPALSRERPSVNIFPSFGLTQVPGCHSLPPPSDSLSLSPSRARARALALSLSSFPFFLSLSLPLSLSLFLSLSLSLSLTHTHTQDISVLTRLTIGTHTGLSLAVAGRAKGLATCCLSLVRWRGRSRALRGRTFWHRAPRAHEL